MKKTKVFILLLVALLIFPAISAAKSLVVIGWDGAGSRNVIPMLQAGKLPGLQSILDAGGVFCDIETINKTVTVPTWTLMFTSLDSSQTGVTTNRNTRQKIPIEDIITNPIRNSGYLIGWFLAKDF